MINQYINTGDSHGQVERRIFGPPGTGKTTTLGRLVEAACRNVGSENVIAASFTRTAARELTTRNLPISDDHIGTLHSLCYRTLDRPKLVSKDALKLWNDEYPTWRFEGIGKADVDDPWADVGDEGSGHGDALLQAVNLQRGLREHWDGQVGAFSVMSFYEAWKDFKQNMHLLDFTDLIEECLTTEIPFGAKVMFLDEVQDFSPLELTLARHWGGQCEQLWLAGDDDQCLYGFKGAIPDVFLTPDLPESQVTVLGQSYRVPRAIHEAAMAWVSGMSRRKEKHYTPRDADGLIDVLPVTYRAPHLLRGYLEDWVFQQGKTVALLTTCSYHLNPLKRALREWGMPFHNPYRTRRGDWNPLLAKAGTVSAADRLMAFRKVADGRGWWTHEELWRWTGVLEAKGVFAHGAKTEMRRRAEEDPQRPVAVADLEKWIPDASDAVGNGNPQWFLRHALTDYHRPLDYAATILDVRGADILTTCPKVIVGTIHSVKGGEADIVVLFPDLSQAGFEEWCTPGEPKDRVRRTIYVGMTRARESLYWAQPVGLSVDGYL